MNRGSGSPARRHDRSARKCNRPRDDPWPAYRGRRERIGGLSVDVFFRESTSLLTEESPMTRSPGPIAPVRPGGPSRAIQGSFPGGQPKIPRPAVAAPAAPTRPAPLQAHPAAVPPAMAPRRPNPLQPARRPGFPGTQPQPIRPAATRPGSVQPFAATKPAPPQPIRPSAAGPARIQPFAANTFALPPGFQLRPSSLGERLPEAVQQKMETFFKTSFADVRVHVGNEAKSIGALAFTLGTDLYFAPGQYNPQTLHGQQLLGHELTHVLQQRAGRVANPLGSGLAVVQDPALEAEAEAAWARKPRLCRQSWPGRRRLTGPLTARSRRLPCPPSEPSIRFDPASRGQPPGPRAP